MNKFSEIGPGWQHLVDTFTDVANWDVLVNDGEEITDVRPFERAGALTLHYGGGNRRTDAYAAFASKLSEKLCKECGRPVPAPHANGFQSHYCEEHE